MILFWNVGEILQRHKLYRHSSLNERIFPIIVYDDNLHLIQGCHYGVVEYALALSKGDPRSSPNLPKEAVSTLCVAFTFKILN